MTAAAMALLGVSLAGCETAGNLLGSAEGNNGPQTALTAPPTATPPGTTSQRFAVAAVFGAPDNVAKQMQTSITGALQKSNLAIAQNPTDKAEYTLRGYVVSAREKTGSSEQELRELILEEAGTRYGVWKVRFDRGEAGEAHPSIEALRDALVDFGVLQEKAAAVLAEAIPDRVVRMQVERR